LLILQGYDRKRTIRYFYNEIEVLTVDEFGITNAIVALQHINIDVNIGKQKVDKNLLAALLEF
jgi:hypothetical protein